MHRLYAFINLHRTKFWWSVIILNLLAALDSYIWGSGITGTVFLAIAALAYMYKAGDSL